MGLSVQAAQNHIAHWTQHYTHSYRTKWPSRLFHHAPLENALQILNAGCLQSRADTDGLRARDVAAIDVLGTNGNAYRYARLYFRPRTPTQYHIEGIRKDSDCQLGVNAHAPLLVMFVFNALDVLTRPDTQFSDQNMQKSGTKMGGDDAFFATIPFDKVYHEGAYSQDQAEIKDRRAAEVLANSPLPLAGNLQWVLCRSAPERETLLYHLGAQANLWAPQILVSDDIKVFLKSYPYVQDATLSGEGFTFRINPRPLREPVAISIQIWNALGQQVGDFQSVALELPPPTSQSWIYEVPLAPGSYRIKMMLEGHLAYEAIQEIGGQLF